ncbi:uncharacterized protein SEPMUDRAFT_151187 [Sphaerulina musiva SO2202]|uniref:Mid2 domain-containing protein n=1 Tax=Sphaerulina musiva (strain SO2202) TaxID=692275 RepID=M3AVR9_SPHMS|nr:uncharacterized protein SEPMUDRAFT_151187 [Sphaerulina musiva SO2202]EMF10171.1 hypothetical protein SEPMUDRAFT_151187 [Sphaerulina musiva SO2202]
MFTFTTLIALPCMLRAVSARTLWIPQEWENEDWTLTKRADTCGGDSALSQCGSGFPSDFCCGENTVCLSLNTTTTITAALCCPAGQSCSTISPVSCDQTYQNATSNPGSQLHSKPTARLDTCGDACCPMGYRCSGKLCIALSESEVATTSSSALSSATSSASPTATTSSETSTADPTSTPSASASSAADAASTTSSTPGEKEESSSDFSGKSFVAGFIPGIMIGVLLLAALIFCLRRRKQSKSSAISEKKHYSKDTLTDLGLNGPSRRPTVHGRSISEPTVDMSLGHRTDFANRTSPEQKTRDVVHSGLSGYVVNVESPARRPANPTPQGKAWLSHSPFVNQVATPKPSQSPLPRHLKRGTLSFDSFKISPVRGRRQSQQAPTARLVDDHRPDLARQGSTETIKVAMGTPSQNPSTAGTLPSKTYQPQFAQNNHTASSSNKSWQTTHSSRSPDITPIEDDPDYSTPTRPGRNSNIVNIGASLNSPYTTPTYPAPLTNRDSTRTQPQVTYPPMKATTASQPYPTPQSSAGHRSYVAPVAHTGHASTFADTGMPFLKSPNLQPPSPAYAGNGKGRSRLTGLFPNWSSSGGGDSGDRMTRVSRETTWGGMIEKAGLRRSQLYTGKQGDPREWNRRA